MKRSCLLPLVLLFCAGRLAADVTVSHQQEGWVLLRDGRPFYIQGAVAPDRFVELKAAGANAVRANATRALLDEAQAAGLAVMANLPVRAERNGMDWNDDAQFEAQRARIVSIVHALKHHPAVLFWAVGNELDYIPGTKPYSPRLWERLNALARAVKAEDPTHPVATVLGTSLYEQKIQELARAGTAFDLLGINAYGDLAEAAALTRKYWPKPYVISEWGPTGYWEVRKTAWGAPIEQTSTQKAAAIETHYRDVILGDRAHCLGSFVFYWAEKQETTHTWFGLFLDGLRTESIDVMEHFWRGQWPANRAPTIEPPVIADATEPLAIKFHPGEAGSARVRASDPDGDALAYAWDIRPEVVTPPNSYAGGGEVPARPIEGLVKPGGGAEVTFTAPTEPGPYRLYVTVRDGHDHIAYANVPFEVIAGTPHASP